MVEVEEEGPGEEQRVGEKKTAWRFLLGSKPPKLWRPVYMYMLAGGHVTSITSIPFAPNLPLPPQKSVPEFSDPFKPP